MERRTKNVLFKHRACLCQAFVIFLTLLVALSRSGCLSQTILSRRRLFLALLMYRNIFSRYIWYLYNQQRFGLIGLILLDFQHDFLFSRQPFTLSCHALKNTNWTERSESIFFVIVFLIQLNFIVHIQYEKIIVSVKVVSGRDGVSQRKIFKKVISLSWVKA